MRRYYYFLVIVIAISSCKRVNEVKTPESYSIQGDTICIGDQSPLRMKIRTSPATLQVYNQSVTASGVVKVIPNDYAQIASPFAGRILKSFVHLGQHVNVGSPVFEISSVAFYEAVKEYFQAQQELRAASLNLRRESDLVKNKVGVKKEEEDAALNYALKKKEVENCKAALSVYHLSPQQLSLGKPLIIRSPIAGEVVKNEIVMGQYLKDDAEPIATVANLNKVWVVAHVKEKDIDRIRALSHVDVSLLALPNRTITGKVYHINDLMDEDTHSVEVIIECNNQPRLMKPGMYGYVKLVDKPVEKIIVPSSAILQEENSTYVFVKVGKNKFMKREVNAVTLSKGRVVILSGLNAGEEIITKGAFYLNSIF